MKLRHFLSISDLESDDLAYLVNKSLLMAKGEFRPKPLKGKFVGIYFTRSSTRTRTAFTVGTLRLGAQALQYGPSDLQISTGETLEDTARVLSGFLDALVVRTNGPIEEMKALAAQNKMAVINAMSSTEHPTQAIADLAAIREALGRLTDVHVLYVGEGNSTAAALANAIARMPGMQLTIVSPQDYGLPRGILESARAIAAGNGTAIEQHHSLDRLPVRVDVVYATRWQTMGEAKPDPNWREKFEPYRVTQSIMRRVSKPADTIFLHDLPAVRGGDVTDEVLDGPQSRAFRQACHKLTSAMAILSWCLGN